jgi:hypothetical protein
MLSRETGHRRVPAPPHINTGISEVALITPSLSVAPPPAQIAHNPYHAVRRNQACLE